MTAATDARWHGLLLRARGRLARGKTHDLLVRREVELFTRFAWLRLQKRPLRLVTTRPTEFAPAQKNASAGAVQPLAVDAALQKTRFVKFDAVKSAPLRKIDRARATAA